MNKKSSKKLSKKQSKKQSKKNCCAANKDDKKCVRKSDNKEFNIEKRRFSKKTCLTKPVRGMTMRASCAPYKDCHK
jgi:hypothetical protein